jgi:hypothetical protein
MPTLIARMNKPKLPSSRFVFAIFAVALLAAAALAAPPAAAPAAAPAAQDPRTRQPATVKQVASDLYFFYDYDGSNAVFLVTDAGILVIDAREHPRAGQICSTAFARSPTSRSNG